MQRTNIYLNDHQIQMLDQAASLEGVARAEIIRRFVDRGLQVSDSSLESDLEAIITSFGTLSDTQSLPRQPDDRQAYLDKMWQVTS